MRELTQAELQIFFNPESLKQTLGKFMNKKAKRGTYKDKKQARDLGRGAGARITICRSSTLTTWR